MSNFLVKEKIDSCIYSAYNLISDLVFNFNFDLKNKLKRNSDFENVHHGRRCFILATGPSINELTAEEVGGLDREITVGVNSMYKSKTLDRLIPNYYTLLDNHYWGLSSGEFAEVAKKYAATPPTFITDIRAEEIASAAIPGVKHICLRAKNYPVNSMRYDPTGNMSIAMNVVGSSILLAIYMGFKEIYLLGCDFNSFCTQEMAHCYDDTEELSGLPTFNLSFYLKYYHITAEFHYLIARLAKERSIRVVNLSKKSLLDAYPRGDLKRVLRLQ
ncbi:6-hydroxymethylpterin diphosphokinase MptE-like protein [Variovorax boronicumulans]